MAAKNCEKTTCGKISRFTLVVKNSAKIALSHTISEMHAFCIFCRKFKMAAKNGRKQFLEKKSPVYSADTLEVKHFVKITISHRFQDKCIFAFYAEIQDGRQKWQENNFWEKLPDDCRYPGSQKFHQNHSILHCF